MEACVRGRSRGVADRNDIDVSPIHYCQFDIDNLICNFEYRYKILKQKLASLDLVLDHQSPNAETFVEIPQTHSALSGQLLQ